MSEPSSGETEHGDRVIYCDVADRYLLGRTPDGECPFCGEDLTGERLEQLRERVAEHTGRDDLFTDGGTPTGDTERICLDLCAGLGGFSSAFEDTGNWRVVTVEIEEEFEPDICADVLDLRPADLPAADVVLASPPCTTFSKACPSEKYWNPETKEPDHPKTREHITLTHHIVGVIKAISPDYWFLENPVGRMRWILGQPAGTVSYCQYGKDVMKPTDLWGDHPQGFEYRWCGYADDCHESNTHGGCANTEDPYPRSPAERAKVPYELSESILRAVEGRQEQQTLFAVADGGNGRSVDTDTDRSGGDLDD